MPYGEAADPALRDASDGAEKPQRTGYSAFAEYDESARRAPAQGIANIKDTPSHSRGAMRPSFA